MNTRAERRRKTREIVKHAKDEDVDALAQAYKTIDILKAYCVDNKARLEHIAVGLQIVTKLLLAGDNAKTQIAVKVIMQERLSEARDAVERREQALDVCVAILKDKSLLCEKSYEALEKVKQLCPDLFPDSQGKVEPTAPVATA